MSVVPMKRITVAAMKRDRKAVLEYLQVLGVVQVSITEQEDDIFTKTDMTKSQQVFLKSSEKAEDALAVLKRHAPEKTGLLSSLKGRKPLSVEEFDARTAKTTDTIRLCGEILELERQHADLVSRIPKLEDQKTALEPWLKFDLPMDLDSTRTCAVFIGTIQGEYTLEEFYTQLKRLSDTETFHGEIISADATQTCIFLVCEKEEQQAVREALRRMNFATPPQADVNPADRMKELEEEIAETIRSDGEVCEKIRSYASWRDDIRFASDYFTARAEKYGVISQLLQSKRVFFLEGFIPEPVAEDVAGSIGEKFDAAVEIREIGQKETPPVLLKNNGFSAPLESVTESYSLPGKKEIDPTFLSSLFYYILFGIMLSDAGYGILMFLATGIILLKFGKTMETGMKKTMRMFFLCGIATTFWGFMFGSFFGDAVAVVGQTFLGKGDDFGLKPLWFAPLDEPMRMLTFCFIIALIHMFVGLGAKAYMQIKQKQYLDMVYDVILWYVLLISCIVFLLTVPTMAEMLSVSPLSPSLKTPMAVLMAISAVGIILTGGRESRNWVKRILKGLYALYGISGWLSDILSYSRLLALGLATGVIAQVFNSMGSMGGKSIPGVLMFIVVFLIGNVLNLAINALGAYVHTNRLTYVEFFGKFYEGGGQKFRPFAANTRYYKFKDLNTAGER